MHSSYGFLNNNEIWSVGKTLKLTPPETKSISHLGPYLVNATWDLHHTITLGNLYQNADILPPQYIYCENTEITDDWDKMTGIFLYWHPLCYLPSHVCHLWGNICILGGSYWRTVGRTLEGYLHSSHFASSFNTKSVICSPI